MGKEVSSMNLTKPQKLIYDMEKFSGGTIAVICGAMLSRGNRNIEELKQAVNELYRLNDALRIHISETGGEVNQVVTEYREQEIEVLSFENKTELDSYAGKYAKVPLDFYGNLCEIKVVVLPKQYGILVKMHHIIGDAWTLSLVGTQFNRIVNGEGVETYSYTEYVNNEMEYFQSKRCEKDKQFFIEQFKKCDEVTFLEEKQSDSVKASRKTYVIDYEEAKKINDYVKQKNSSAYVLFTSALAIYMNRIKMNAEKFYIGTAVLNRNGIKEKNTMGMFVNTVPMLIELDNTKSFADNFEVIKSGTFSVFRHQRYNYGKVLATIRKEYGFQEKLYDVMISYQNATITGGDSETTWYHSGEQSESLQIHIDDRDNEGIFRIHYDYLIEKFTEHEIDRLHEHICNLLFDAIKNDTKKIYELDILSANEKNQLLYEFNNTGVDYPKDKCVHQLFEEQVERTPDKVAVVACDKTLTYRELNGQANRIAHSLLEKGIGVGDIVAFALPRKSYLIATIFGILKSGAAYLPIDPDYPQNRIDYMLEDSNAKVLVTEKTIMDLLASDGTTNPLVHMTSDNLCYCIYTSGSTGQPKGVLINHSNVLNFVCDDKTSYFQNILLKKCEHIVALNSITFDITLQEIHLPLLNAKSVIFLSENELINIDFAIGKFKHRNCGLIVTPTKLLMYMSSKKFCDSMSCFSVIMSGAETFPNHLLKNIRQYSDAIIFDGYGPTETTCGALYSKVDSENDITIGKPIANTQVYIVDKYMKPTPIGVTGELCIAGDGVGAGYLNRPKLTAEKFIENPFGEGKLYKTGDLAYWREDGNIVYVGRNDFQVKIRGLRIELGEIENAIRSMEGITQSVVVVRKNNEGRQLICAFYTGAETDAKEIRNHIGKKLPKYMLPHIFTHINDMPLTSSGKVNRKALPEVDLYAIGSMVEYIAPITEQQKILVTAIEDVLGVGKVGVLDNFFDIGGDSLKAIELLSKLEKERYHTDIKTIFSCDTVKELAEKLTAIENTEDIFEYVGDVPATAAQMRVYTAQSMESDSTIYNVPYAFKVAELDVNRLQDAVEQLIARHEILCTHFENKDGNIIQVINNDVMCHVEQLDSDDISAFVRPFDLSKAPLFRMGYFENTVMIDMHHIITDGSSMPVFFHELNELYMGRILDNQTVQYKQFAAQKHDYSESEKYWLSVYNDELPVLEINTDFKRGQKQSFKGKAIYDTIDVELHNKILAFCKAENITPYVFYMSGFNILLSKFSNNEDIVVGMPISGRDTKYLNTIGMFVNTIALRNKPVGTKTVREFLHEVKENSILAIEHQDYPYGELVKKLNANTTERNPLFDVMFAYQSEQMTDVIFGDKKAEVLPVPITTSKYDFTFNIMPRNEDVVVMVEYCTELYKESTVHRLVNGYTQILEQLLNGKKQLKEISVIDEKELQKLLFDFNDTEMDYPRDKCVHQLFEQQAGREPNNIALIFCDKQFTFSELNCLANGLARELQNVGVSHGDVVAIISKRSYHIVVAMLAIFKCGAAYLPIDYNYPKERIDHIAEDARCKVVLTYNVDYEKENVIEIPEELIPIKDNLNSMVVPQDICGIIYTSGSTGQPKGTLLHHQGLVNYTYANDALYVGGSCNIGFATYTFDAFFLDIFPPMLRGNTAIMATEEEQFHQIAFESLIRKHPGCNMFITPAKFKQFVDNRRDINFYEDIHNICIGGEVFPQEFVNLFGENTNVFNVYGPTECSMWMLECPVRDNDVTLGKPLANVKVYILDKNNMLTPIGVTGELCIAGDGVGAGYLNRPELTAEKFKDNPFGEGKLYKTGDLAYWREDGNIVYVGRNDFQVKIRGLRIELGEIENAICSIDGITQAVVVVRKNNEGRQLICAFYTGEEVDAKEIRNSIGKKLPKYMLPHICTHLEEMPLTSSGKINRKELPAIELQNTVNEIEYVRPENKQQKELCELIELVLGTSPVGITDDFFDLGGDSLKAIEFVSKAHNEGIYFNLQNVFDYPTVKELCECIANGDKQVISFADVDFSEVNKILEKNKSEYIQMPRSTEVGNILLAGATGYLGIHILADYLDNDFGTAYCLVRGKDVAESVKRLQELLQFYFGEKYAEQSRIQIVCADLQKDKFGLSAEVYQELLTKIDTVINCAASVKHYGSYKYFYEANVETTKRLIDFCKEAEAKLIHTSTLSVSGNTFGDAFDGYVSETEKHFYESSLYIGQPLDNVYGRSKFEAEKAVLDAMTDGLKANIMRMGNLTNRLCDGQFQKNYESNAFLQRVKGVLELGMFPDYLIKDTNYSEFTPIDEAANAVMTIARHFSTEQTVFHINSIKVVYFDKLIEMINQLGYELKLVSGSVFTEALRQTAKQTGMEHIFETFINDMDENDQLNYDSNIRIENDFTVQYLKNLGFEWSDIDIEYMQKYIEYFREIGYFR